MKNPMTVTVSDTFAQLIQETLPHTKNSKILINIEGEIRFDFIDSFRPQPG